MSEFKVIVDDIGEIYMRAYSKLNDARYYRGYRYLENLTWKISPDLVNILTARNTEDLEVQQTTNELCYKFLGIPVEIKNGDKILELWVEI